MLSQHRNADKIIPIPKQIASDENLKKIVAKYKTLRLTGLQSNPEAFTSTYAREIQFNNETWTARVVNPLGRTFVALLPGREMHDIGIRSVGASDDVLRLIESPWLGQLTLMGPVRFPTDNEDARRAPWELFKDIDFEQTARVGIPAGLRVVYVIVGMYVLPEGRGVGNGKRLVEAAIEAVDGERKMKGVNATVVILVAHENLSAKRLYERVGFVAREETVDIEGDEHWALFLDTGGLIGL